MRFEDLRAGLSAEEAVQAFREGICKPPDRFWLPSDYVPELLEYLRTMLHSPVTDDEAFVLHEIAVKRQDWKEAQRWWDEFRDLSWDDYQGVLRREREDTEFDQMLRDYKEWSPGTRTEKRPDGRGEVIHEVLEEVRPDGVISVADYLRQPPDDIERVLGRRLPPEPWTVEDAKLAYPTARPCPVCGIPAAELVWRHVHYCSAVMDRDGLLGGWSLVDWMTFCDKCKIRVDRFKVREMMA